MILDLSKYSKFITVSAFRTPSGMDPSVAMNELRTAIPSVEIQFFEGAHIAGKEHLEIAVINAVHAFKIGTNISRSLAMETLLYASAQRQIDVAISNIGVTRASRVVGLVAFSESRNGAEMLEDKIAEFLKTELNDRLLNNWSREKISTINSLYGIAPTELEAIRMPGQSIEEATQKAVIERVALLSTRT